MIGKEQCFGSLICVCVCVCVCARAQDVADNQIDTGDLMECLVQNKHQKEMNEKCSVGVTHFQLVSYQDNICFSLYTLSCSMLISFSSFTVSDLIN